MYKCTECGLEFESKPEYCDCGNNEFVIVVPQKVESVRIEETVSKPQESEVVKGDISQSQLNQSIEDIIKTEKKYFPFSPYAFVFFVVCVILSLLILFFWNPVKNTVAVEETPAQIVNEKPIPSIDKIWKNPVITDMAEPAKVTTAVVPVKTVKPITTVKPAQTNVKPKQTNTATKNNNVKTTVKTSQTTQKPVSAATTINKSQPSKSTAEDAVKKAADAEKAAKEAKQKAEALAAAENAKKNALAKQELANYKINLRNAIGRKIDFTKVIGDGNCTVAFKLDSSGKLINRSFEKQSSNITLNNSVYNAILAVPSFNPPPSAYHSETLRLYVRFTNGNFAITLE